MNTTNNISLSISSSSSSSNRCITTSRWRVRRTILKEASRVLLIHYRAVFLTKTSWIQHKIPLITTPADARVTFERNPRRSRET